MRAGADWLHAAKRGHRLHRTPGPGSLSGMQEFCHRCGGDLPPGPHAGPSEAAFCPHCGAPQLTLPEPADVEPLTNEEPAAAQAALAGNGSGAVDWHRGLLLAAAVAMAGGVLSLIGYAVPIVANLSFLWALTAASITVTIYAQRSGNTLSRTRHVAVAGSNVAAHALVDEHPQYESVHAQEMSGRSQWEPSALPAAHLSTRRITTGIGARLGAATGILQCTALAVAMAIGGLVGRYNLHRMGAFDAQMTDPTSPVNLQLEHMLATTPELRPYAAVFHSPEFLAGRLLGTILFLGVLLVIVSTASGALSGRLRRGI
jgi:hypothetical protein